MLKFTPSFASLCLLLIGFFPLQAHADKGTLYVQAYIEPSTAEKTDGAQYAPVYIYDLKGEKISSGKGDGAWKPGTTIHLQAGEYWVGLGQEEVKENLRRYRVEPDKTTVVQSGWVSVATLVPEDQPHINCATWNATLMAFMPGEEGPMIIANDFRRPAEYGIIQLHPGDYQVEFHGFRAQVTVKAGMDYRLPTGYTTLSYASEVYLLENKNDDPQTKGLPLCTDGASHVLAGDYTRWEMVKLDDGQALDYKTDTETVDIEGSYGYTSLKGNKVHGDIAKHETDGELISPKEVKALTEWGKKKGEFDDLQMFGDPI